MTYNQNAGAYFNLFFAAFVAAHTPTKRNIIWTAINRAGGNASKNVPMGIVESLIYLFIDLCLNYTPIGTL